MTRRRGTGEGSVYQLSNGKWRGVVDLGWRDGRRVRKYVRGATAADVKAGVLRLRASGAAGLPPTDDRVTTGQYLASWLKSASRRVRPTTLRGYEQAVRLHLTPAFGSVRLTQLQPTHVERMMASQVAAGASPTTARLTRNILRAALAAALRRGLVARNVAALAIPPRLTRVEIEPPTPAEARSLLEATANDALGIVWLVALTTGLRRGELVGLQWRDLDWETGEMAVRRSIVAVGGRTEVAEPKTAAGKRYVVLPPPVVEALRAHRRGQLSDRLEVGPRWRDGGWMFANTVGGHLDPAALSRAFAATVRGAGLRPMRLHDCRHGVASYLIGQGKSARLVQGVLGHGSPMTTLSIYSHLFKESRQEAADALGAILLGGTTAAR